MESFRRTAAIIAFCLIWSISVMGGEMSLDPPNAGTQSATQKIKWRPGLIRIGLSTSLFRASPNIKADSDVRGALRRAMEEWQSVAGVEFAPETTDRQSISPAGAAGDGVSLVTIAATAENALLFTHADENLAARTRVFFNRRGVITEADIALNPYQQFSTDGTFGTFDLETIFKHEIGHLLGLHHSPVVGSIMYEVSAKNGVFGGGEFLPRSIADDDISAIRDLYGAVGDDACCGTVSGRITTATRGSTKTDMWLIEADSGRVVAHGPGQRDGTFRIGGVPSGRYSVMVRSTVVGSGSFVSDLGNVEIAAGQTVPFSGEQDRQFRGFSTDLLGFNGILSDSPLVLRRGERNTIYLGGTQLVARAVKISTGSQQINISAGTVSDVEYGDGVSGLSLQLSVDDAAIPGSYDLCAESETGGRDCIPGGLIVTK